MVIHKHLRRLILGCMAFTHVLGKFMTLLLMLWLLFTTCRVSVFTLVPTSGVTQQHFLYLNLYSCLNLKSVWLKPAVVLYRCHVFSLMNLAFQIM